MNFIGEKEQWHFESHDSGDTCHDAETNPQLFVKTAGTSRSLILFVPKQYRNTQCARKPPTKCIL